MNRVKINFLGIKFKMSLEKNIFAGFFDSLYTKILIPFFVRKNKLYIENKKDNIVRRLFITTGNISLINNISIINQFHLDDEKSENDIVVWSGLANSDFLNLSKEIFDLFGLNKYFSFVGSSKNFHQYLIKNFLTDYDEVYFINLDSLGKIIQKIYKYSKLFLTDEGALTLIPIKSIDYKGVSKIIATKYLGKMDYLEFPPEIAEKFIELDKKEFLKVSDICTKLRPLEYDIKSEDRWIILCGTFNAWRGATFEELLASQKEIAEKLISKGYKILFKPHPRDRQKYEENDNFKIFNTKISLECYRLNNVMAVVSIFSSVSLQIYHFQNVPSFILTEKIKDIDAVSYRIVASYAPSVELLYAIDTNCSSQELQQKIREVYQNWLAEKPMLSENRELIALYNRKN